MISLADRLDAVELDAGALLFEAGAPADAAYVLLHGELEIRASDGTFLDREMPGALVGEQALMPGGAGTRSAAVVATQQARLLRVEERLFAELFSAREERQRRGEDMAADKTGNRLGRLSGPFRKLLEVGERRAYAEGEVVFEEGDPADGLHLILSGRAEVVTDKDGEPVHLSTVYAGQCFGEIATLEGVPRTATVIGRAGLRTAFVPLELARALHRAHPELEQFLNSLLRSYQLPRRGALHQRSVFRDGRACIETVYELDAGRELTALREPEGRYRLSTAAAEVKKELEIAVGTRVSLDAEHRIVALEDAGAYDDVGGLQALALDGLPLSVKQRKALRKAAREAELQRPDAVICRCMGLTRATLEARIAEGLDTAPALQEATGCGTVCGGCMKALVPAMLPATVEAVVPVSVPAQPARASARLPRVPRLIPWLGNFTFSRDPAGFQSRGHQRLGPVFGAHLMGLDFVFIDPVAKPGLVERVLGGAVDGLDAAGAWDVLGRRLCGEAVLAVRTDLTVSGLPERMRGAVDAVVAAHGGPSVDALAMLGDAVSAAVLAMGPPADADPVAVARLLERATEDTTASGALMPVETPSIRRRLDARRALESSFWAERVALLLAVHRNATLAAASALLDLAGDSDAQAVAGCGADSLAELRDAAGLQDALAGALRRHGGGAVWRRATRDLELDGVPVPEGALVGAVLAVGGEVPSATLEPAIGGIDAGFGRRGPAAALPEVVAALVLARVLAAGPWAVEQAPRRWTVPVVPGMQQPVGALRLRRVR